MLTQQCHKIINPEIFYRVCFQIPTPPRRTAVTRRIRSRKRLRWRRQRAPSAMRPAHFVFVNASSSELLDASPPLIPLFLYNVFSGSRRRSA